MSPLVFISHASSDIDVAMGLCSALENRQIRCWIAPRDIPPASEYGNEIIRGIEKSDATLLLLTSASNKSDAVYREIERSFSKSKPILTIAREGTQPSGRLEFFTQSRQWLYVHDLGDHDANAEKIRNALSVLNQAGDGERQELSPLPRERASSQVRVSFRRSAVIAIVVLAALLAVATVPTIRDRLYGDKPASDASREAVEVAERDMNEGRYQDARNRLEEYLAREPADDFARYALAYSHLLMGALGEAKREFEILPEGPLRSEGAAAVAYFEGGSNAEAEIREQLATAGPGYINVLLALIDMMRGRHQQAADNLANLEVDAFRLDWQHVRHMRTLGRAYLELGSLTEAAAVLERLPDTDPLRAAYLKQVREEQQQESRRRVDELVDEISILIGDMNVGTEIDTWTSHPLSIVALPIDTRHSPWAFEAGFDPWLLNQIENSVGTTSRGPVENLERSQLEGILTELRDAAKLNPEQRREKLGQFEGASGLLAVTFWTMKSLGDSIDLELIHVASSKKSTHTIGSAALPPRDELNELSETIMEAVEDLLWDRFPLRGILTVDNGIAELNIGKKHGVSGDMIFDVRRSEEGPPIEGVRAVVTAGSVGEGTVSGIVLEGWDLDGVPENGLFVMAIRPGSQK